MTDITFDDLASEAADAAEEATSEGQGTGEFISETVKLLDKRGLLEPMLFGKERLPEQGETETPTVDGGDGEGVDLSASTIAEAGRGVMDQLGEDVTVAELVDICESNPSMVNQQLADLQGGEE